LSPKFLYLIEKQRQPSGKERENISVRLSFVPWRQKNVNFVFALPYTLLLIMDKLKKPPEEKNKKPKTFEKTRLLEELLSKESGSRSKKS